MGSSSRGDGLYSFLEEIPGLRSDALREGLLLRYQFPHDDIKVCEITEEVMQGTVLH